MLDSSKASGAPTDPARPAQQRQKEGLIDLQRSTQTLSGAFLGSPIRQTSQEVPNGSLDSEGGNVITYGVSMCISEQPVSPISGLSLWLHSWAPLRYPEGYWF
jgi:hypothetical protein